MPYLKLFKLIIRVHPKLASDIIDKQLEILKIFFEGYFKLWLCNKSGVLVIVLILG